MRITEKENIEHFDMGNESNQFGVQVQNILFVCTNLAKMWYEGRETEVIAHISELDPLIAACVSIRTYEYLISDHGTRVAGSFCAAITAAGASRFVAPVKKGWFG